MAKSKSSGRSGGSTKANLKAELAALHKTLRAVPPGLGCVTPAAAAKELGVSRREMQAAIAAGELLTVAVRGARMVPRSEVRRQAAHLSGTKSARRVWGQHFGSTNAEIERELREEIDRVWRTARRIGLLDLDVKLRHALSLERLAKATRRDPKRVLRPVSPTLPVVRTSRRAA